MARCLVLDVLTGKGLYEKECNELQDYYDALGCDCFDIATRKIDGRYFDMFVDDVGLFSDNPIPSALDKDMKPMLVGNIVFANHDNEGNTTSLLDEDIDHIRQHTMGVVDFNNKKTWDAVFPVEY